MLSRPGVNRAIDDFDSRPCSCSIGELVGQMILDEEQMLLDPSSVSVWCTHRLERRTRNGGAPGDGIKLYTGPDGRCCYFPRVRAAFRVCKLPAACVVKICQSLVGSMHGMHACMDGGCTKHRLIHLSIKVIIVSLLRRPNLVPSAPSLTPTANVWDTP
jgi:hypothetical protein